MDPNTMLEIAKTGAPILQSSLSGIVGAILGTLFLRRNTTATEFEKLKAGKFSEVTDKLLADGKMSYLELYRCNNFLKIAQLADAILSDNDTDSSRQNQTEYDFDWFICFFDAAGYISSQEMQQLWAQVLAGEISNHGLFSFRTLDSVVNKITRNRIICPFYKKSSTYRSLIWRLQKSLNSNIQGPYEAGWKYFSDSDARIEYQSEKYPYFYTFIDDTL